MFILVMHNIRIRLKRKKKRKEKACDCSDFKNRRKGKVWVIFFTRENLLFYHNIYIFCTLLKWSFKVISDNLKSNPILKKFAISLTFIVENRITIFFFFFNTRNSWKKKKKRVSKHHCVGFSLFGNVIPLFFYELSK